MHQGRLFTYLFISLFYNVSGKLNRWNPAKNHTNCGIISIGMFLIDQWSTNLTLYHIKCITNVSMDNIKHDTIFVLRYIFQKVYSIFIRVPSEWTFLEYRQTVDVTSTAVLLWVKMISQHQWKYWLPEHVTKRGYIETWHQICPGY